MMYNMQCNIPGKPGEPWLRSVQADPRAHGGCAAERPRWPWDGDVGSYCLNVGVRLGHLLPAAVRRDMVLHQAFRARHERKSGIGGEVRHGVTSGVSSETSLNSPPQGVYLNL